MVLWSPFSSATPGSRTKVKPALQLISSCERQPSLGELRAAKTPSTAASVGALAYNRKEQVGYSVPLSMGPDSLTLTLTLTRGCSCFDHALILLDVFSVMDVFKNTHNLIYNPPPFPSPTSSQVTFKVACEIE